MCLRARPVRESSSQVLPEARRTVAFPWTHPTTGAVEGVPRHAEISDVLPGTVSPEIGR